MDLKKDSAEEMNQKSLNALIGNEISQENISEDDQEDYSLRSLSSSSADAPKFRVVGKAAINQSDAKMRQNLLNIQLFQSFNM